MKNLKQTFAILLILCSFQLSFADYINSTNYGSQIDLSNGGGGFISSTNFGSYIIIDEPASIIYGSNMNSNIGFFLGNISIAPPKQNVTPTNLSNVTFINSSNNHGFTATASAINTNGATDIVSTSINTSDGTCLFQSNTTNGYNFTVTYSCIATSPATTGINITFVTLLNAINYTNTSFNSYPDHRPNLTSPSITPNPADNSTALICNNGLFSDVDGDIENTSAIYYVWILNGSVIIGQNTQTLNTSFFGLNDTISCNETTSARIWTSLNTTNSSTNITIQTLSNQGGNGGPSYPFTQQNISENLNMSQALNKTVVSQPLVIMGLPVDKAVLYNKIFDIPIWTILIFLLLITIYIKIDPLRDSQANGHMHIFGGLLNAQFKQISDFYTANKRIIVVALLVIILMSLLYVGMVMQSPTIQEQIAMIQNNSTFISNNTTITSINP